MKNYKLAMFAVVSAFLLSACASGPGKSGWYDQWGACAAAGAAVGVAGGATDDFDKHLDPPNGIIEQVLFPPHLLAWESRSLVNSKYP